MFRCHSAALFVGCGMGAVKSYEGVLKLKEISYLHAEAYSAGEMKHGPIALINEGFPVIAIATKGPVYEKVVSNLLEARDRGAKIVVVATEGDEDIRAHADHVIYVPKARECFVPIAASVPPADVRLRHRPAARVRCRPAQEPGQERDGGVRGWDLYSERFLSCVQQCGSICRRAGVSFFA